MKKAINSKKSLQFKTGIFFLILSFPVAYGLILIFAFLAAKTGNSNWLWWSGKVYAMSWGLLGLAILLIGKQGVQWFKREMKDKLFSRNNITKNKLDNHNLDH